MRVLNFVIHSCARAHKEAMALMDLGHKVTLCSSNLNEMHPYQMYHGAFLIDVRLPDVRRASDWHIVYQRGSKHGRRYEFAVTFEDARRRVTAWVRRNERDYANG